MDLALEYCPITSDQATFIGFYILRTNCNSEDPSIDELLADEGMLAAVKWLTGHARNIRSEAFNKLAAGPTRVDVVPELSIYVDTYNLVIFLSDGIFTLKTEQEAAFVQAVVEKQGRLVTFSEMVSEYPVLLGGTSTRIHKRLPKAIRELINTRPGKGYSLKTEIKK
jgi:hypothetical protein